jgi:hypothetical protein
MALPDGSWIAEYQQVGSDLCKTRARPKVSNVEKA